MKVISLFCGCGGLDRGFEDAGFDVVWANDNDKNITETYKYNHPNTLLRTGDISKIKSSEIPDDIIGLIGGPPCQSWSAAGNGLGIKDPRGKLFYEYIRILKDKQPHFFLAENVKGILSKRHAKSLKKILKEFDKAGYNTSINLINTSDYGVPQNRERVIIVGYHKKKFKCKFQIPTSLKTRRNIYDALSDLNEQPIYSSKNLSQPKLCRIPNHEYWFGGYSYIFMSRNRVLSWDSPSYTIQASGRQTSIHPQAPKMEKVEKDIMEFKKGYEHLYRRLSVRECARLQTFNDDFIFLYKNLNVGYKMIGNAVPVELARILAEKIKSDCCKPQNEDLQKVYFNFPLPKKESRINLKQDQTRSLTVNNIIRN